MEVENVTEYETNSSRMDPTPAGEHRRVVVRVFRATSGPDEGQQFEEERCLDCGSTEGPF